MENKEREKELCEAYLYAYPAVILELTRQTFLNGTKQEGTRHTNTYYHNRTVADASFTEFVAPNIDTAYSQAFLDLRKGALLLNKPATDRYMTVTFLDAYTNCEYCIGTGADGNDAATYFITGPDFYGEVPVNCQRISLPTNFVWSMVRTILYGREDLEEVKKLQEKLTLTPYQKTAREEQYGTYLPEKQYKPIERIAALTLKEFFDTFNALLPDNPDLYAPADKWKEWGKYGIGVGKTFLYDENIKNLEAAVKEQFDKLTFRTQEYGTLREGWSYTDSSVGIYRNNYRLRADVARNGLGANPMTMCVYAASYLDNNSRPLCGTKKYRVHFEKGQLPPVGEYGFWSITLYDNEHRYLVANKKNRYGINDRDVLAANKDGSVDIYLQTDEPEASMVSNWLPTPKEGFHLVMRIYLPKEAVLSGEWKAPKILAQESE